MIAILKNEALLYLSIVTITVVVVSLPPSTIQWASGVVLDVVVVRLVHARAGPQVQTTGFVEQSCGGYLVG